MNNQRRLDSESTVASDDTALTTLSETDEDTEHCRSNLLGQNRPSKIPEGCRSKSLGQHRYVDGNTSGTSNANRLSQDFQCETGNSCARCCGPEASELSEPRNYQNENGTGYQSGIGNNYQSERGANHCSVPVTPCCYWEKGTTTVDNRRWTLNDWLKYGFIFVLGVGLSVLISTLININIMREMLTSHVHNTMGGVTNVPEGMSEQNDGLCFDCPHLRVHIGSENWRGVDINPVKDECCFKDKFHVMLTFKHFADVKFSILEGELNQAKRSVQELYDTLYRLKNNGSSIALPVSPDLKEALASIGQKKRSILCLKSDIIRRTRHGSLIEWSESRYTTPILQGNLELDSDIKSRIKIIETGVYTIRSEVKFISRTKVNETEPAVLEYHIKTRSEGGHAAPLEAFTQNVRFVNDRTEFDGIIHTVVRLRQGDSVEILVPNPRGESLVSEDTGVHKITVIEES